MTGEEGGTGITFLEANVIQTTSPLSAMMLIDVLYVYAGAIFSGDENKGIENGDGSSSRGRASGRSHGYKVV